MRDPARDHLLRDDVDRRVNEAVNAVVRHIAGGCRWTDDRVRKYRGELERAVVEYDTARRALACLDDVDRNCGEVP